MDRKKYENLSDKEKEELLNVEKNEIERMLIIQSFSTDDLKLRYIATVREEYQSAIIHSLSKLENKIKAIENLKDEKYIADCIAEIQNDRYKILFLKRIQTLDYKIRIIQSINGNESEILSAIDTIKNEKDKSIIISRLKNDGIKYNYLNTLQDINNKGIIVTSIDDERLKEEYISRVQDNGIKSLLIASLKNREKRNQLLETYKNKYKSFNIPNEMTVGMEIECEGERSLEAYLIDNILNGYHAKIDTSLKNGVEVTTPALTNNTTDIEDIYCVCKIFQSLDSDISERCGGHIHVGADYLETKEAYANLIELWCNNEELIYLISNPKGEISREGVIEHSTPISKKIENAINDRNFKNYDDLTKEQFIEKIKNAQENYITTGSRRTGINFLHISDEYPVDTIEFRLSNGTINPDVWIENAMLFAGIVASSQKLSDIQNKNMTERSIEENEKMQNFVKLKDSKLNEQERLDIFLKLCIPDEIRQIYSDRYFENKKILLQSKQFQEELDMHISKQTIEFISEESVKKIAKEENVALEKENAKSIIEQLEITNPQIENDIEYN